MKEENNNNYPNHVAIIMDGNGRWAESKQLSRNEGHAEGVSTAKKIINYCIDSDISHLSLFAFSSENTRRPKDEIEALMQLFLSALKDDVSDLHDKKISLKFIGDLSYFSNELVTQMRNAEAKTKNNKALKLIVAVNYGGRWDILQAIRKLTKSVVNKVIKAEDIDEQAFSSFLSTNGLPEPDLFIRTSGEQRISNFFLWQLAYTELYFSRCFWPDFSVEEFKKALHCYTKRNRKFGMTLQQLENQEKNSAI